MSTMDWLRTYRCEGLYNGLEKTLTEGVYTKCSIKECVSRLSNMNSAFPTTCERPRRVR